jgi:hypothetical protein
MSVITESLDKIATSLENKGLLKEAEGIDLIANTIEAMEKEAWTVANSKQYNALAPAINAAQIGNVRAALGFLKNGEATRKNLEQNYPNNADAQGFSSSWLKAVKSLENADAPAAVDSLNKSIGFLRALEPVINAAQASGQGTPAQKTPNRDLIFPAPGAGNAAPKRSPLPLPNRAMR